MGERAFEEDPTDSDMEAMKSAVQESVKAGAIGFSTSRSPAHMTSDNRLVASRVASDKEVQGSGSRHGRNWRRVFFN